MSQIQEVKDANNIVDIIAERVNLQSAGINFKACCPFHQEKTPSFFVHPEMQRYRCFGCGANGDVLDFLQNYEGMTFFEALKYLADRSGIELKDFQRSEADEERDALVEILNLAKEYYHYLLTEHQAGEIARQYLKNRGTTSESIKIFQLGFSLDSWDGLIKYLHQKKKYPLDLIAKTGLILQGRGGRYYDRFRGRLMFPLKNHRGQVVGFSGRVLDKSIKEAKYINSPETALYHKSKMLYGYHELFREIKRAGKVVVVEGEFDMISSAQAHINNVVAIKGSALSSEQAILLSRVAKTIILSLDADEAGIKATRRAIEVVKDLQIDLRVVDLKHLDFLKAEDKVKDPDDLARSDPKLWREAVESAVSVYAYLINAAFDQHDASKPDGKRRIINDLAPVINLIDHAVEREFYLQKLSQDLNVKESLLKEDIERFGQKKLQKTSKKEAAEPELVKVKTHQQKMEEYLLFLLFKFPSEELAKHLKEIEDCNLQTAGAKQILLAIKNWSGNFNLEQFAATLAEDLKKILLDWVLNPEYEKLMAEIELEEEWQSVKAQLKKDILRSEIKAINDQISSLDKKLERSESEERELDKLLALIVAKQRQITT